jgi:hypothetical protein
MILPRDYDSDAIFLFFPPHLPGPFPLTTDYCYLSLSSPFIY